MNQSKARLGALACVVFGAAVACSDGDGTRAGGDLPPPPVLSSPPENPDRPADNPNLPDYDPNSADWNEYDPEYSADPVVGEPTRGGLDCSAVCALVSECFGIVDSCRDSCADPSFALELCPAIRGLLRCVSTARSCSDLDECVPQAAAAAECFEDLQDPSPPPVDQSAD